MINEITENIVKCLMKNDIISEDGKDIYTYGLDLIISGLIGILTVLLAGIIIGEIFYAIIYNLIMVIVRIYTGGYHASTHAKCLISYVLTFFTSIVILKEEFIKLNRPVEIVISILDLLTIAIYAPLENKNKVLSKVQKRKYKIICIVEYMIILVISEVGKLIYKYETDNSHSELLEFGIYIKILLMIITILLVVGKFKNYIMQRKH